MVRQPSHIRTALLQCPEPRALESVLQGPHRLAARDLRHQPLLTKPTDYRRWQAGAEND
jgi:hypothetical protein